MAHIFPIDPAAGLRPETHRGSERNRPAVSNRFKLAVGTALSTALAIVAVDVLAPSREVRGVAGAPTAGLEAVISPDTQGCTPADEAIARYVGGNSLELLQVRCNPVGFVADSLAANR
jgi:hypothetical protein